MPTEDFNRTFNTYGFPLPKSVCPGICWAWAISGTNGEILASNSGFAVEAGFYKQKCWPKLMALSKAMEWADRNGYTGTTFLSDSQQAINIISDPDKFAVKCGAEFYNNVVLYPHKVQQRDDVVLGLISTESNSLAKSVCRQAFLEAMGAWYDGRLEEFLEIRVTEETHNSNR